MAFGQRGFGEELGLDEAMGVGPHDRIMSL